MAEPRRSKTPSYSAPNACFLIVEARYYDAVGEHLLEGAKRALKAAGATYDVMSVPGALELPGAIRLALRGSIYAGAVALGCVIRGETYHFEVVSNESARGLMELTTGDLLAVGNGVLTVENEDQAMVRADPHKGDKGGDAARAALALYLLKQQIGHH